MRVCLCIAVVIGCGTCLRAVEAIEPPAAAPSTTVTPESVAPQPATPFVDIETLADLGKSVAAIRYESDNVFFYAQRSAELREAARALEGKRLEFIAKVSRVSEVEVIVELEPAGKTRLVLMHAALPVFGNLQTVAYHGVPSTHRLHIFSAPVGLRIGSEIQLELAKTLRRRDTLVLHGTIASLPVWIESVFAPDAVALLSDWRVVDVNPEPAY